MRISLDRQSKPIALEIPRLFSLDLVWETLQQVLSDVFHDYVDYNNTVKTPLSTAPEFVDRSSLVDWNVYFTKRVPTRSSAARQLFQFSHSGQVDSMTSYFEEHHRFLAKAERSNTTIYKEYVCKPNYRHITVIYDVLRRIIQDIDLHASLHPSKRLLDRWERTIFNWSDWFRPLCFRKLTEFIRDRFIGRVIDDIRQSAQLSSSSHSDQKRPIEFISSLLQKELQLSVPILHSTYLIFKSCEELSGLVQCLPSYADEFCQAMIDLLFQHRESCDQLFHSLDGEQSIYSYQWVKDVDINRHLRTLPAFDALLRRDQTDHSETVRFRQMKETEMLLINLSDESMTPNQICTNYKHLELLGTIHESLYWLYKKLVQFFDLLEGSNDRVTLSRLTLEIFSNALRTTLNLAYDILLLLYLEIRIHCVYYLSLLFRETSAYAFAIVMDTDEQIISLNLDLTRLQETLRPVLDETEFRYVFRGLGCFLSASLIRSVPRFDQISESGAMKMCRNIFSIEQVLAQIGLAGDAELMRAQRFREFLSLARPEDLLSLVEEYGTDYTEEDSLQLLQSQ